MNVTALMLRFRESLLCLIPVLEEASIGWRDGQQYDSFSTIAEALFRAIVIDDIEELNDSCSVGNYIYDMPPYESSSGSYLYVMSEQKELGKFVRFSSCDGKFDQIILHTSNGAASQILNERISVHLHQTQTE